MQVPVETGACLIQEVNNCRIGVVRIKFVALPAVREGTIDRTFNESGAFDVLPSDDGVVSIIPV